MISPDPSFWINDPGAFLLVPPFLLGMTAWGLWRGGLKTADWLMWKLNIGRYSLQKQREEALQHRAFFSEEGWASHERMFDPAEWERAERFRREKLGLDF